MAKIILKYSRRSPRCGFILARWSTNQSSEAFSSQSVDEESRGIGRPQRMPLQYTQPDVRTNIMAL